MEQVAVKQQDMQLLHRLFGETDAQTLPVAFRLGGRAYKGIPSGASTQRTDGDRVLTRFDGGCGGVTIRAELCEYRDFPVCEWQIFFRNDGDTPSALLSELRAMDFLFPAAQAILHHGNGDTRTKDGFSFFDDAVGTEPIVLSPLHGTSCEGAYPFLRLVTDAYVAAAAIGWSGKWQAAIRREGDAVRFTAGQARMHARLLPGETFCTPRMTVMLTDGTDQTRAANLWRRWYRKYILPKEAGQPLPPKACLHVIRDGPEFTDATTQTQLDGLRRYLEKGLKPDVWWIDAGWYPCGNKWKRTGTWEADEARFPQDGLAPVGEACRKNGIEFLLWFEPERVTPGTALAEQHADWLLRPNDPDAPDLLLDLGNRAACDWLIGHVNDLIRRWHVGVYRQDFNRIDPLQIWIDNEAEDRVGALENLHIQGYWRFWDALLAANPGLWIDSCASGGRRNDLETLRRSVPLHYTDVGYGDHPIKQRQYQALFAWAPYFRSHTISWDNENGTYEPRREHPVCDEFAYLTAFAPAITVTTSAWGAEEEFALGRRLLPVWRRAAELMLRGDYYPTSRCGGSPTELYAVEFSDPARGDGLLHVIRNTLCETEGVTARLHVDPAATYRVENGVTGETRTVAGATLADGFAVTLPKRSGAVWFYTKIEA